MLFISIISFDPSVGLKFPSLFILKEWGSEGSNDLLKITQLARSRARTSLQVETVVCLLNFTICFLFPVRTLVLFKFYACQLKRRNVKSLTQSHRQCPFISQGRLIPKSARSDWREGLTFPGQWWQFHSCTLHPDINEAIYRTDSPWQPSCNHLRNQSGMKLTLSRAEQRDGKNLGPWWHLELMIFAWPGAAHLWAPS